MSATVVSEAMVMSVTESQPITAKFTAPPPMDAAEFVKCECCGLNEECTPAYIERIKERFQGKWICGLCSEAVKDEIVRCDRLVSTEEALNRHINFCNKFKSSPPSNPTVHLISAMRQIMRRSFDSPRTMRSMPTSPRNIDEKGIGLTRSESCIPTLSLVDQSSYQSVEEST